MALDRLIAELVLTVGILYMGLSFYNTLGSIMYVSDHLRIIGEGGGININVPDAVIVSTKSGLQLYLVITNVGNNPVIIKQVFANNVTLINDPVKLNPGKYVLINSKLNSINVRIVIIACTETYELCLLYPVNATYYPI